MMNPAKFLLNLMIAGVLVSLWPRTAVAQEQAQPLRVCLVSASAEYKSDESLAELQKFIEGHHNVNCTRFFGQDKGNGIRGLENVSSFDVMVLFTRRIVLPEDQLAAVKKYVAAGKPIVGIRTASHAFENFLQIDKEVFGGSYSNHYGNDRLAKVQFVPGMGSHPVLAGVPPFATMGKLYKNAALAENVTVLLTASTGEYSEPVAWTHPLHGGRMFYTSLGIPEDFQKNEFKQLLLNAIFWTAGRKSE